MLFFSLLTLILALPVILEFPPQALGKDIPHMLPLIAADHAWLRLAVVELALWTALWWAYFIIGWGWLGATPGQWILGLRVVDHRGRCPIGPARAALRLIAYSIGSLPFMAGHLLVIFRTDARSLHDVLAGTRVVRARSLVPVGAPRPGGDTTIAGSPKTKKHP
ncbi:MAG: RDD family protein [Acidobacteria bacterium]|nr:RDD family protein [Acidobacteriota bacterium]